MKYLLKSLALLLGMLMAAFVRADDKAAGEISRLLDFIAATPCRYERNGQLHDGQAAAEHIRRKYDHFRKEIASAEEFIARSASKSERTGRKYRVLCEGRPPVDGDAWLLEELKRIRK